MTTLHLMLYTFAMGACSAVLMKTITSLGQTSDISSCAKKEMH